jgi:hypothetical protein
MSSVNIWMILWFVTSMTSSFKKNKMVDHERHVHLVLEKLRKVGLYAKLEKCGFHKFEVEFLGYIISRDGVRMDLRKVQTIVDWATSTFV